MKFSKQEIRESMLLYAITDRMWLREGESLAAVCKKVLQNGATFLQIREKTLDETAFIREAAALQALCAGFHIPFVVNDNVSVALAVNADGVHVGQSDIKGKDIRAMIGKDKILGISAGTVEEAIQAEAAGADYIGVGAVFGSKTKKNARNSSVEKLREITSAINIPVVAVGGIHLTNIMKLSESGVDGAAVISAVFAAEDPGKATAQLFEKAKEMIRHG